MTYYTGWLPTHTDSVWEINATEHQTLFGILLAYVTRWRRRDALEEDSEGWGIGMNEGSGAGRIITGGVRWVRRDARAGVSRINWYPLGSRFPPVPLWRCPCPCRVHGSLPSFPPPPATVYLSIATPFPGPPPVTVGFGEKKRAGIFLSIPPGSLFFTLFFSPPYRPTLQPGGVRAFFFRRTPLLARRHCVSRHRDFFHTGVSATVARGGAGPVG